MKLNFISKLIDLCVQTDVVHWKYVSKYCIYGVPFVHSKKQFD